MNLVRILLVGGSLLAAIAIFFVASRYMGGGQPAQQGQQQQVVQVQMKHVLVAARPLPAGTQIKLEDVKFQGWPPDGIDPSYFVQENGQDPQKVAVGMIVLHGIDAGEPITAPRLLKPGEAGFLAAALEPGRRAITVRVDQVSGEAGFILPGDHVDLVLHQRFNIEFNQDVNTLMQNLPAIFKQKDISSVIQRNVKVLAINQGMQDIDSKPNGGISTATLDVDLEQAQKILIDSNLGTLSLILRSHTLPSSDTEFDDSSNIVDDIEAEPYHASMIQKLYAAIAKAQEGSGGGGGLRVYHGTQLAGAK